MLTRGDANSLTEDAAEDAIGEATRHLLAGLGDGPCLVALYDASDTLRYANTGFWQALLPGWKGLPLTFANIVRHWRAEQCGVIIQGDVEDWLVRTGQRRRTNVPRRSFEVDLVDGRWLWLMESRLPDGWILSVGADITELKQTERALRNARENAVRDSRTDMLTGLPNRRHILELADAAIAEHHASAAPLAVAVIDLDHFKRVNDSFGHAAGDQILQHFAKLVSRRTRHSDHFGRIGGEEFLLLLPDIALPDARAMVEWLRQNVPAVRLAELGAPLAYSFSIGLTALLPGERLDTVLARADTALYAAKRAGRDRVECLGG